ncbi:MAG: TetR family transcriptional regulator [Salinarimonas sp.]|nr:TetR family transcriptional regulator [Salinarimonas sp.]
MQQSGTARDGILDAAQRVAARDGAGHVTLDAVAREAGVSKGGVLYHFPGKDALISGMLERLIAEFEAEIARLRAEFAGGPNPSLRAMIAACGGMCDIERPVAMAILAAGAQNPDLLAPLRASIGEHLQRLEAECPDPDSAFLLCAAADGMMFQHILGIAPYDEAKKRQLLARLAEMAQRLADEPAGDRANNLETQLQHDASGREFS